MTLKESVLALKSRSFCLSVCFESDNTFDLIKQINLVTLVEISLEMCRETCIICFSNLYSAWTKLNKSNAYFSNAFLSRYRKKFLPEIHPSRRCWQNLPRQAENKENIIFFQTFKLLWMVFHCGMEMFIF